MSKLKVLDLFSGYSICENGEIVNRYGAIITPQLSKNGYIRVELWQRNKGKKYLLHRLLAEAFIPNPSGHPVVNHIDGNKTNNDLGNLEWCSRSENQIHAYRNGLQKGYHKSGHVISDLHKAALCGSRWKNETHHYSLDGINFTNLWDAAEYYGVSRQTVLNRCKSAKFPQWTKSIDRREKCQRS